MSSSSSRANKKRARLEGSSFADFDFDDRLAKAVSEMGWEKPTQVQSSMIPLAMEGKNIVARARTGSGKTAAFLLPLVEKVLHLTTDDGQSGPFALIIAPTKELATQIHHTLTQLTSSLVFLQMVNFAQFVDERADDTLKEVVDIVVSTPARLLSILKRNRSLLQNVQHVVLDEADLLFSYGYKEEMKRIREALPSRYQTIMTSATLDEDMSEIKSLFAVGSVMALKLKEGQLPGMEQLSQYHIFCNDDEERFTILLSLIKLKLLVGKSVIFVSSTDRCYKLHLFFTTFEIPSGVLNSQMPANYRYRVIQQFNEGKFPYIIASECNDIYVEEEQEEDVGRGELATDGKGDGKKKHRQKKHKHHDNESGVGRGIDFHFVSNVVNFDFPTSTGMYIHRVGRTARGWNKGTAISFASPSEKPTLEKVQKQINEQMGQPVLQPYEVRMKDFESFQLRTREALAACSKSVVRETRMAEIRNEILKSKQLEAYFASNPREKEALEQNSKRHKLKVNSPGIADVPFYMVPPALRGKDYGSCGSKRSSRGQEAGASGSKKRKRTKHISGGHKQHKKRMADPLQSFKF